MKPTDCRNVEDFRELARARLPYPVFHYMDGARACLGGHIYLYALAAAGQAGVKPALTNLRAEIERDMKLMGVRTVGELIRENLRWR